MKTLFSVREARRTGVLTVSATVLAYSNKFRGEAHTVSSRRSSTVLYCNLNRFSKRVHHQVMRARVMHTGIQTLLLSSIFHLAE
jgi:hypothetical protein